VRVGVAARLVVGPRLSQARRAEQSAIARIRTMRLREIEKLAAALGLAILLGVSFVAYRNTLQFIDDSAWILHKHRALGGLVELLSELKSAEIGQQGYLFTGDKRYLEPYRDSLDNAERLSRSLVGRIGSTPEQQQRVASLSRLLAAKFNDLSRLVEVRRNRGLAAAQALLDPDADRSLLEEIRALADVIKAEEEALLGQRTERARRVARNTLWALGIGSAVSLGLLLIAGYLFQSEIARRRRSEEMKARMLVEMDRVHEDLREHRSRLEELAAAQTKELQRSNQELEQFAYVASHDLQEPLRKVQAFGERLERKHAADLSEEGRDYLMRMVKAAERMQGLIGDLLTYSRVNSQGRAFAPVDLRQVAEDATADLELAAKECEANIVINDLPVIEADGMQMRRLFQNLIENAIKYRAPERAPRIEVVAADAEDSTEAAESRPDRACRIEVRDNGIGFEDEYRERIFGMFQRLHPRDAYPGSGVGLAICRRIAERHGGTLTGTARPGAGAVFTLILPVAQPKGGHQP